MWRACLEDVSVLLLAKRLPHLLQTGAQGDRRTSWGPVLLPAALLAPPAQFGRRVAIGFCTSHPALRKIECLGARSAVEVLHRPRNSTELHRQLSDQGPDGSPAGGLGDWGRPIVWREEGEGRQRGLLGRQVARPRRPPPLPGARLLSVPRQRQNDSLSLDYRFIAQEEPEVQAVLYKWRGEWG